MDTLNSPLSGLDQDFDELSQELEDAKGKISELEQANDALGEELDSVNRTNELEECEDAPGAFEKHDEDLQHQLGDYERPWSPFSQISLRQRAWLDRISDGGVGERVLRWRLTKREAQASTKAREGKREDTNGLWAIRKNAYKHRFDIGHSV